MISELRVLLRLGLPVMLGQVGTMLLHSVDTLMLGNYGVQELAAAALGTQWIFLTLTMSLGLVMGIDPIVAQRHGAQDALGTGRALQHGLILALLATLLVSVAWLFTEDVLLFLGQDAHLSRLAHRYVILQLPSIFPFLAWAALRSYLQGREIVRPAMWVMIPVNIANALLNWLLIFGFGEVPAFGLDGAAVATCLSRILSGVLLLGWLLVFKLHVGTWEKPRWLQRLAELREPLALGLPIALQMGLEVTAFAVTAAVAGQIGEKALAAHSIVLSFAALLFMIPLGIAFGTTTRVGNLIGAGLSHQLGRAMRAAMLVGAAGIALNVSLLIGGHELIAEIYTDDLEVRKITSGAFLVAAAFQFSDCIQVVCGGALRGMGRTRVPAVATFVGYYIFGIPCGYYLGVTRNLGLAGLWWGLAIGLTVVAVALLGWLSYVLKQEKSPDLLPTSP